MGGGGEEEELYSGGGFSVHTIHAITYTSSIDMFKNDVGKMMMPFNCSYRNKNEPTAIYPSLGYSPPPERN